MATNSRMFCGVSLAVLLSATSAFAQERTFDVPAGPAANAIPAFARQAGFQIIAPAGRLKGVVTPAVKGRQDARAALKTLLAGTNLEIAADKGSVIILREAGATTSPQADPTPAASAGVPSGTNEEAAAVEEVLVTGSRVIRNGNNSPTPITVVAADDIQRIQPTTIADGLNQLPVFSSPRNQYGNPNAGVGGGAGGNAAANQLNLRNLGSVRNLILMDGHRVPPTSVNGIVDVDMVPQMLLQRVDTVTGGVSAVYGSDAVTGVVNFITDTKFTGLKVNAQVGVSKYGDDQQQGFGVAYGTRMLADRGHFEISYEYRNDEGVLRRSDRPWFHQQSISGAGTTAAPYQLYSDVRLVNSPFGGKITSGVLANQYFATNGVLSPFVNGTAINGSTCCQVGGAGGYYDSSLKAPLRSHQVYSRFDYDLTDSVHAYVAASFNDKRNEQYLTPPLLSNVTMSSSNAFLSSAYQAQLAGQPTFSFAKMFDQAPRLNPVADEQQVTVNAGLDGKFGDNYTWGINYTHGEAKLKTTLNANPNNQRLAAALDAVISPTTGQPVCYASLSNSYYANCVPLNVFGPTSASAAAINYIMGSTHMIADTGLDAFSAEIGGSPFSTWAGPVAIALSGEWRELTYHSTSDALPTDRANCAGLRYNCTASTVLYQNTFAARTPVSDTVKEAAVEIDLPLLNGVALAKSFNLNGAARYTSYDSSGDYWTWKLGADWHLTDDLRVRATRSRDIRAPTLDDLYAPASVNSLTNKDELTGLTPGLTAGTSPVPGVSAGNPDLTAEIGDTTTVGLVWQPAPRLSFAVDAYWIKISDAISNIQGFNPTIQKACYASGGSSPYCALQSRPLGYTNTSAANLVTEWRSTVINISEIESNGVDFEANWGTELFGRSLTLRGLASYQPHIYYRTPALVTIDAAGSAFGTNGLQASPKWRLTGFFRYAVTDTVTVDVMERWRSELTHSADPTQVWIDNHVDSFATTSLNVSWRPTDGFGDAEYFLNIQNLFNATPPATAFFGAATIPGQFGGFAIGDDPTGRYVTVGARMKF